MNKFTFPILGILAVSAAMSTNAHAIDRKYAKMLERSGCTQVSEAQGCDINKTKAENTKAGFGSNVHAKSVQSPPEQVHKTVQTKSIQPPSYKDLAGKDSISALDIMTERGFKSVDSFESGNTQYVIYHHPSSHLCIQLTMADGKMISGDDIHTHPKCH